MKKECELNLLNQQEISLRTLIESHKAEVRNHEKQCMDRRKDLIKVLERKEELEEMCKCKEK